MKAYARRMPRSRLLLIIAVALFAALYVAARREAIETRSSRVEIAMDWGDFQAAARSYDYNQRAFLTSLRRAGLTSLAISEELGGSLNSGKSAYVQNGQSILQQARLSGIADPTLRELVQHGQISADSVYLTVFDPAALDRYMHQLRLHFDAKSIRVLRTRAPFILAVRTQLDYFDGIGLGLPEEPRAVARQLGFFLMPRLQNDERYGAPQIDEEFREFLAHERVSTVVFFGLRNEVLGYPDHLEDAAAAFKRAHVNFGIIETYDRTQEQKGSDGLAIHTVGQNVRVQAISKAELDKLDFETVVARYLLGARERNVRVVYIRPLLHQDGTLSIEATNVELVRRVAEGLRERSLTLGRATPIPGFRVNPLVLGLMSLAIPALVLLAMEMLGRPTSTRTAILALGGTAIVTIASSLVHHDMPVRKLLALAGGILFASLAVTALAEEFVTECATSLKWTLLRGLRTTGIATGISLCGALLVIGLMSTPLTMEEIDRFTGVKAVLLVPPLVVLCVVLFTRVFGNEPLALDRTARSNVRVYQLIAGVVLLAAGAMYLARSGNQSDIAPSTFELALRSKLTALLVVRPRFKEFLIGFPTMMILPAFSGVVKRNFAWLFALAIGIGTSDIIDTFSHLHTPIFVSLLRIVIGFIIGTAIGALVTALVRRRRAMAVPHSIAA